MPGGNPQLRVLVADDVPAILCLLKELVRRMGAVVLGAADYRQVLDEVEGFRPHLVLLDIQMPGPACRDVVEILQTYDPAPAVVLLTGLDDPGHSGIDAAQIAGTIKKPFDLEEVRFWVECIGQKIGRERHPGNA